MAAQNQKIEYLFAAHVTGQGELAKLTDSVDKLRKEMDALKAASGGVGAATQQYTRSLGNASSHVQAYRKHLDDQAKAMRNSRIGTMQAGMQVNDFVTSVSTGASPVQAFNQQIGQVGYAMQMMGGTAGKVGNFLAGPWSILVIGASMAIGALIENFMGASDESKKLEKGTLDLSDSMDFQKLSTTNLIKAIDQLDAAQKKATRSSYESEVQARNTAAQLLVQAVAARDAAKAGLENTLKKFQAESGTSKGGGEVKGAIGAEAARIQSLIGDLDRSAEKAKNIYVSAKLPLIRREVAAATDVSAAATLRYDKAEAQLTKTFLSNRNEEEYRKGLERITLAKEKEIEASKGSVAAARRAAAEAKKIAKEAESAREKEAKSIESFMDKIGRVGMKEIPAYQRDIALLEKDFFELSKTGQAATIAPFKAAVESIEMQAYGDALKNDLKDADKMVKDALPNMGELPVSKEMTDIISRADELNKSFEEIGNTVSEAFKGMLTGAMSWKDGMRSLIGSVIDQLWKLFVVQKIVGLVTGALGGTSTPVKGIGSGTTAALVGIPANAYGGSVMGNKPTLVGERGPELFVPGGNGTIIPNSNMRGGGGGGSSFNISVDARGSSDPAAVRAQVQQGILEAAPAIIAAAESRTIAGLRRPRLGGAMQ